ncbi:hypothetical protein BMT54_05430 [Pasteurellaceae bacterium 15-036681]|nr:hypothetical protein BMT54_05430 [Pasteurellaceae bacterium 15-036681]
MKFVKFLPVTLVAAVLAACSTPAKQEIVQEAQPQPTMSEKFVAFQCANKNAVVVKYKFAAQKAVEATVTINKKAVGETFVRDDKAEDPTFVSGKYVLNADTPLALDTATKTDLVNIFHSESEGDVILAKNCKIEPKTTAKLNK